MDDVASMRPTEMDEVASMRPSASVTRGRWAMIAACALLGAAVFVSFLVADFPYGDTLTSILAPYQLKLTYSAQHLNPPIGARLTNVRLFSTTTAPGSPDSPGSDDDALLQSPVVTLAPTLASLLFGRPGMHVHADLYGGIVRVTLHQHAGAVDLDFSLDSLKLAQSAQLRALGAIVDGTFSGNGTAQINGPNLPDDHAALKVNGDQLAVSIVNGFPAIHVGTLTGDLKLEQGAIKLVGFVGHGADLDLKADGTIQLGQTADDSTIDLTLYLDPTQAGRDHFGFFMKLLPHPPGPDAPFSIEGDLLSPSIS
jgi:type II secretion system protein N